MGSYINVNDDAQKLEPNSPIAPCHCDQTSHAFSKMKKKCFGTLLKSYNCPQPYVRLKRFPSINGKSEYSQVGLILNVSASNPPW